MKERPILFSAPMVRALLAGTKTQTRRILKLPPEIAADPDDAGSADERNDMTGVAWLPEHESGPGFYGWMTDYPEEGSSPVRCPYGQPGDRLWVREAFMPCPLENPTTDPSMWSIAYASDAEQVERLAPAGYNPMLYNYERWAPSIHMPRWASRLTLEITGVRVERLQDISEADAMSEGIERAEDFFGCPCWKCYGEDADVVAPDDPIGSYRSLWESINGPGSWGANPWVWVVEFERTP